MSRPSIFTPLGQTWQLALLALTGILVLALPVSAADDMDALFKALKNAPSEQAAESIESQIWENWLDAAPTPDIRAKVDEAMKRRGVYDFQGARDLLDEVVDAAPDYSEGWNQRAFILFLQGNYDESLEDIMRVLELEPRHFGALSGRAMIFMTQGRVKLGQKALREAVAIHPYLKERSMLIKPKGVDL
ncbi:tetratricopeptide repeat protein [Roseibium sp.]|uniref:tetratricopeptide repeat protein n=1 Tax=Roseibium sp. TaxID=1936156 RepID=UPI003BAE211D